MIFSRSLFFSRNALKRLLLSLLMTCVCFNAHTSHHVYDEDTDFNKSFSLALKITSHPTLQHLLVQDLRNNDSKVLQIGRVMLTNCSISYRDGVSKKDRQDARNLFLKGCSNKSITNQKELLNASYKKGCVDAAARLALIHKKTDQHQYSLWLKRALKQGSRLGIAYKIIELKQNDSYKEIVPLCVKLITGNDPGYRLFAAKIFDDYVRFDPSIAKKYTAYRDDLILSAAKQKYSDAYSYAALVSFKNRDFLKALYFFEISETLAQHPIKAAICSYEVALAEYDVKERSEYFNISKNYFNALKNLTIKSVKVMQLLCDYHLRKGLNSGDNKLHTDLRNALLYEVKTLILGFPETAAEDMYHWLIDQVNDYLSELKPVTGKVAINKEIKSLSDQVNKLENFLNGSDDILKEVYESRENLLNSWKFILKYN